MSFVSEVFNIKDKVAIITGASSGLGVTFAKGLSKAGAKVVLAARREDMLEALEQEIKSEGGEVLCVPCDVTKEEDVKVLVSRTCQAFGGIDILVNNAGISNIIPAESEDVDDFGKVLQVNVTGTFLCAKHCAIQMLKSGKGSIINIASILGMVGSGQIPQAGYVASKGAVVNLTRELAAQWARRGVRVNAIAPGWFYSEMTEDLFSDEKSTRFVQKKTPMGRSGAVEELIGPLLMLASDASSFMTGQTLLVDGGWTII